MMHICAKDDDNDRNKDALGIIHLRVRIKRGFLLRAMHDLDQSAVELTG